MGMLRNPRRHPHVADTVDYLRHCGADDIRVSQTKRLHIDWRYAGQGMSIALPIATRNSEATRSLARQKVRRRYREAGIEVSA